MTTQKLFLSYSRSELYFAESVVHALVTAGFDVWFDIQRLLPGMHWGEVINEGVAECDALVLIASRASLRSYYVGLEWDKVREANKPIYILLFENVRFAGSLSPDPAYKDELREMSLEVLLRDAKAIIDCRGQFNKNVERLITLIKSGEAHRDPIPEPLPGNINIPTRFSRGVAVVALAVLLNFIAVVEITINVFSISLSSFLAGLLLIALLGIQLLHFLQRRFRYGQVRRTLLACAFLISPLLWRYGNGVFTLPLAGILLWAWILMSTSKDLLRWAPRGQAPASLRRGINLFSRFRQRFSHTPTELHFTIHHHPADQPIANQVRRVMIRAGFQHMGEDEAADNLIHFAIISTFTQMADFAHLADSEEQVIMILASSLKDVEQYEPLLNRQLLDYRTQDVMLLRRTAEELREDSREVIIRELSVNLTPQGFTEPIVPSGVQTMTSILFLIGALVLGAVAFMIRPVFTSIQEGVGFAVLAFICIFWIPASLIGVGLAWLSNRLLRRDLHQQRFLWLAILPFGLGGLIVQPLLFMAAAWGLFAFVNVRHWLPTQSKPRIGEGRFRWKSDRVFWQRSLATYSVILLLVFSFLGDFTLFQTAAIDTAAVTYTDVSITPMLTLQIPNEWHSAPLADSVQRTTFEANTRDAMPFERILDRGLGKYGPAPTVSSSLNDILALADPQRPLGRSANLVWGAVYAPAGTGGWYYFLTAWKLHSGVDPFTLLTEWASTIGKFESIAVLGDITSADRQCLNITILDKTTEIHCVLDFDEEDYVLTFKGSKSLFESHRSIVLAVLQSARSAAPAAETANTEATP